MFVMKGFVLNRARVEGCIANQYLLLELSNLCAQYLDVSAKTTFKKLNRNETLESTEWDNELSIFRKRGGTLGKIDDRPLTAKEMKQIELYVLLNCPELDDWVE